MFPRFAAAILIPLFAAAAAVAQPRSHLPIPPAEEIDRPGQFLRERLNDASVGQTIGDLQRLSQFRTASVDRSMLERMKNDPAVREIVRRFRDGDEELLKLAESLMQNDPRFRGMTPDQLRKMLRDTSGSVLGGDRPRADGDRPNLAAAPRLDDRELAARRMFNERLSDLLKNYKLDEVVGSLKDSPTFKDMLRELSQTGPSFAVGQAPPDFLTQLTKMEGLVGKLKEWMPKKGLSLPKFQVSAESLSLPVRDFSLGTPSSPLMPTISGDWSAAVGLLAIAMVGVLAWRLSARARAASAVLPVQFLVEPIDPNAVGTREDLIRAFEYVALLRFGPRAAHWHHRRVADRLTAAGDDRGDISTVTDLYEHARYAPIPLGDWAAARAALRRLAEGDAT